MKKLIILAVITFGLAACSQDTNDEQQKPVSLETEKAKFSYALGMDVGKSLTGLGEDLDPAVFIEAFETSLSSGKIRLSAEEAAKALQTMGKKKQQEMLAIQKEKQAERLAQGEKNKVAGEAFLAANKKKEGIITTASGLQYEVVKAADGAQPNVEDTVKVHYRGTLIDGTEFDSSYSRNEPATFPLKGVIPGWTEGVQLMHVGSKFRFVLPSDLAYGENGAGAKIGSHSTLVFDVELLEIVAKEEPVKEKE